MAQFVNSSTTNKLAENLEQLWDIKSRKLCDMAIIQRPFNAKSPLESAK